MSFVFGKVKEYIINSSQFNFIQVKLFGCIVERNCAMTCRCENIFIQKITYIFAAIKYNNYP